MPSKANKKAAASARAAALAAEKKEVSGDAPSNAPTNSPPPPPPAAAPPAAPPLRPLAPFTKLTPLPQKNPIKLVSNSFPVQLKSLNIFRYDVKILKHVVGRSDPIGVNAVKTGDRARQALCRRILNLAMGSSKVVLACDGAATLYTIERIKDFSTVLDNLEKDIRDELFHTEGHLEVKVELVKRCNLLDVLNEDMENGSKDTTNAIHVILTQEARDGPFIVTDGHVYEIKGKVVKDSKEERCGLGVGLKIVEKEKKPELNMVLDYKKSYFFPAGPLTSLNVSFTDPAEMKKMLKGLRVQTTYSGEKFFIDGISRVPFGEMPFNDEKSLLKHTAELCNCETTRFDGRKYAVQKRVKKPDGTVAWFTYPVENLVVVADQKMSQKHGDPPVAVNPQIRFESTIELGENAKLLSENKSLQKFGIKIDTKSIEFNGISMTCPTLLYGGGCTAQPDLSNKTKWRLNTKRGATGGFIEPAHLKKILILYNSSGDKNASDKVVELKENLLEKCETVGMSIGGITCEDLAATYPGESLLEAIEKKFDQLARLSEKPLVIYADDSLKKTHEALKLAERLAEVVTQQASLDKSLRKQGSVTMQNILMKLNVKAGGLNFEAQALPLTTQLWGPKSTTLFISYDVCHSSGQREFKKGEYCDEPAVVGFAFNGAKNPQAVIGDFHYQLPRQEEVEQSILKIRTKLILQHYHKNRGALPESIVVLRDGVSEGQYPMVREREFQAIREGIAEYQNNSKSTKKIKLALIIATKRNSNRIYTQQNGTIANAPPLTAIDSTITRKNGNELIFLPHCPLTDNATVHPIVFNVLENEGVFQSFEQLAQVLTVMCSVHQRSTSIVSLPETIYAADDYAKRGADILAAYKQKLARSNMYLPKQTDGTINFDELSMKLCYHKSIFSGIRIV